MAPLFLVSHSCDLQILIAGTYGDNLSATITVGGQSFHGRDVTDETDLDAYVKSIIIPIKLYAFAFDLPSGGEAKVTTHDKSSKYADVFATIDSCHYAKVLYEYRPHVVFEMQQRATEAVMPAVPPLWAVRASDVKVADASGNALEAVPAGMQARIAVDLASVHGGEQSFAYLVQVQDADGITVHLDWLVGTLAPDRPMSVAVPWTPAGPGSYTVTAFVWESVDSPKALSPQTSVTVAVD